MVEPWLHEIWLSNSKSSGWSENVMFSVSQHNDHNWHRTVRFGIHPPTQAPKLKNLFWNVFGNTMIQWYTISKNLIVLLSEPHLTYRTCEGICFDTVQLSYQKSKHRGSHHEAKMFHSTHRGQRNELRLSPGWNKMTRAATAYLIHIQQKHHDLFLHHDLHVDSKYIFPCLVLLEQ